MKALITGGEGGLGRAMRGRLEREGYEVESLDLVNGFDVRDPEAWERVEAVAMIVPPSITCASRRTPNTTPSTLTATARR